MVLGVSFVLVLAAPVSVFAATAPSLGAAETYAVFGKAGVTNDSDVGTTHIWGNVGADATNVTGLDDDTQVDGVIDAGAGVEAAILNAYAALDGQGADAALDLAGVNTVTPGVYTVGATTLNGNLILDGPGVYIFRSDSSISADAGALVTLTNGATACNVFWQIPAAMTIGANAQIVGTIIADTELVSFAAGATLQGRALSRIAQVTMDSNQITEPVCAAASSGSSTGTINVVKTVINDNGGTKTIADFPLFVNGNPVVSGFTNSFPSSSLLYEVTETLDPNYVRTFSGDCDINGLLSLPEGANRFCIVTNDDIGPPVAVPPVPPIIYVVKVPNPLALPAGPGEVTYTYTLRNIGTVPVTDVTMVGDTCDPIILVSGDTDGDAQLDVTETWIHTCSTTLSETHTNTVVATGWANGLSAVDIASATVVVGVPVVPPLIHVTKVPNPLTLPAGGGMVTYTATVTNPGVVALSNVILTDDRCSPMTFIAGDTDGDAMLDNTESWTYTCQMNLASNMMNTVSASGEANGFTARDLAIVPVVVADEIMTLRSAAPGLPNAGFAPADNVLLLIVAAALAAGGIFAGVFGKKKSL